jgi:hypothetical protein
MAGDVIAPLAPIETGLAINPLAARRRLQVGAEPGEKARAGVGDLAAVVVENDIALGDERVGYRDGGLTGEMIVAGPRKAQRVVTMERG